MKVQHYLYAFLLIALSSCANQNIVDNSSETQKRVSITHSSDVAKKVDEISGLEVYNGKYLGFNDSGGEPEIYILNPENTEEIEKTIVLKGAKNKDWEDIALSDEYVFVGDFGNNSGNRKDLKIYYFPISELNKTGERIEVTPEEIEFFYPEQSDYSKRPHAHDFDMESLFFWNGKLHLFTKEWYSEKTHHYTLDIVKGSQPAWLVESYDIGYLITAADIEKTAQGVEIAFVGYNTDTEVFLTTIKTNGNSNEFFTNSQIHTYKLGMAPDWGQVEGVWIKGENEICISAEAYKRNGRKKKQNITCLAIHE